MYTQDCTKTYIDKAQFPIYDAEVSSIDDFLATLLYEIRPERLPTNYTTLPQYLAVAFDPKEGPTAPGESIANARTVGEILRSFFIRDPKSAAYKVWVCYEKTQKEVLDQEEEVTLATRTKIRRDKDIKIKKEKKERQARSSEAPSRTVAAGQISSTRAQSTPQRRSYTGKKRGVEEIPSPQQERSPRTQLLQETIDVEDLTEVPEEVSTLYEAIEDEVSQLSQLSASPLYETVENSRVELGSDVRSLSLGPPSAENTAPVVAPYELRSRKQVPSTLEQQ